MRDHRNDPSLPKAFDVVKFVMRYEGGATDSIETIHGFAHLIATGTVWQLQGHYGRMAHNLIGQGYITESGIVLAYPDWPEEDEG